MSMGSTAGLPVDDILPGLAALSDALRRVIEEAPESQAEYEVWRIYAETEKAVAKLKFRMGVERPGVFTELPRSKGQHDYLRDALADLVRAEDKMRNGCLIDALEALRGARTFLRAYLSELARIKSKARRQAALSRRSSSSSS